MIDVWLVLGFAGIYFGAMALRGVFGYLKNKKIAIEDLEFSWKTFLNGSIRPVLLTLSTGALVGLLLAFLKIIGASEIEVSGLDQITPQMLEIGLAIADIGAIGLAMKEALLCYGLTDKQIDQIRATIQDKGDDETLGLNVSVDENGNVIASPETITKVSDKALLDAEGLDDGGEEVPEDEIGKGGLSNTYPEPYRSAPKDSMVDPSTCYNRECVSYCSWKICETTGNWLRRTGPMSAKYWVNRLPENGYYQVSAPREGGKYVGVLTSGQYGHVVWYEYGNTISEYNYNSAGNYGARMINLGAYIWYEIQAPAPTPSVDIKVGDTVLPIEWVDYYGKPLTQTRDYYFVSQISGDRVVLSADSVDGTTYAAVNASNLKKVVVPDPEPTPTPSPKPTEPIKAGDSVIAWGKGYSTAKLTGRRTKDFPRTKMKVLEVYAASLALNQFNSGKVGDLTQTTGFWPYDQVEKA